MKILLAILLLFIAQASAFAKELSPPEHYIDKGACPFEGCIYREWTVNTKTSFYRDMDAQSPILFYADKGEEVTGLTGAVITTKLGQAKAAKPIVLGDQKKISLKAGDTVYLLNYVGEGFYTLWFNGQIDIDQIGMMTSDESILNKDYKQEDVFAIQTLEEPKTKWWVKVRNSKGKIGWAVVHGNFNHMDSHE